MTETHRRPRRPGRLSVAGPALAVRPPLPRADRADLHRRPAGHPHPAGHPAGHPGRRRRADRRRRPCRAGPAAGPGAGVRHRRGGAVLPAPLGDEHQQPADRARPARHPLPAAAAAAGRLPRELVVGAAALPGHLRRLDHPAVRRVRRGLPGRQPDHLRRGRRAAAGHLLAAGRRGAGHQPCRWSSSGCAGSGGTTPSPGWCRTSRASWPPTSRRPCRASGWSSRSAAAAWSSAATTARRVRLRDLELAKVRTLALIWCLFEFHPQITLAVILVGGALAVGSGALTVGGLVGFVALFTVLLWPILSLGFLLAQAQETASACDRIGELLDAPLTVTDRPGVARAAGRHAGPAPLRARRLPLPRRRRAGARRRRPRRRARARRSPWSAPPARARPR